MTRTDSEDLDLATEGEHARAPAPAVTPIVAIVGRPNVGKSTLFNRFTGERRALVADTPGLTRDRIAARLEVEGRWIWLVDTAGLDPRPDAGLDAAVQAQARAAVDQADAILFVVDGKAGLTPEDEAIARTLRRTDKPLLLAVNKCDHPAHHGDRVLDFMRLGFEAVHAVSAEHGTGAFDALEALVASLPAAPASPGAEGGGEGEGALRVAIVGRPNVGKSSTVNRLVGEERVVVSHVPHTTRDAVDIELHREGHDYLLVDTAGLRRPGRREGTGEHVGALMTLRQLERARVAVLVIDADEGFTDQDAKVASLIRENGCACVVLANKCDLVKGERRREMLEQVARGLRFMSDVPVLTVSAKTGAGFGRLFEAIRGVSRSAEQRIPTADLNRWLADVVEKHPPAMASRRKGRHPVKLLYASQVAVRPPTFVIFCSEPEAVLASYERFLENQLRESFGYAGTPIRIKLKGRKRSPRQE